MNVSKEADAVFMRELEQADPKRYANLQRNMRLAVHRQNANTEGTPEFAAKMQSWGRLAAKRAKQTGVLPTGWRWCAHCKVPFEPHRGSQETCSSRCLYRQKQQGFSQTASGTRLNTGDLCGASAL